MFGDCEVVIADYDPEGKAETYREVFYSQQLPAAVLEHIKWVKVEKKGIGIARRMAVEASTCPFILTFDADCYFSRPDAIEVLMRPLLLGEALMVHCPNYLDVKEKPHVIPDILYALRNQFVGPAGIPCEPGLTFSRATYDKIGGWDDVQMGEGPLLAARAIMQLGQQALKYVEEVFVTVSSRRTGGGALLDLDYGKAYRKTGPVDVK